MKPVKFNDTNEYQYMNVLGIEGALTERHIQRGTLPEGFHQYFLGKGGEEYIGSISKRQTGNHAADFITKEEIPLGPEGKKDLGTEDWALSHKDFNFEEFFGCKYSINLQIELAEAKREELMAPKERGVGKDIPLRTEDRIRRSPII